MAGSVHRENVAARVGRWSARHWKKAVFGWLAFVFAAFAIGTMLGTDQLSVDEPGPGESGRVQQILNDEFEQPAKELVLVQSSSLTARSAAFQAAVRDVIRRLEEKIARLGQKVKLLERNQELDRESAAAAARRAPVISAGASGLSIRSADSNFVMKVRGYVQADARFYPGNKVPGTGSDTFLLRRVRPVKGFPNAGHFDNRRKKMAPRTPAPEPFVLRPHEMELGRAVCKRCQLTAAQILEHHMQFCDADAVNLHATLVPPPEWFDGVPPDRLRDVPDA